MFVKVCEEHPHFVDSNLKLQTIYNNNESVLVVKAIIYVSALSPGLFGSLFKLLYLLQQPEHAGTPCLLPGTKLPSRRTDTCLRFRKPFR